ncbi:Alpha/Beta hydrolase protein [Dactylonectria estremocensis]|uniref:Kynurenine formamidase n=1 Tax=Dactylonectria estremocensis TaxID=1079267 RepID=A0A9P9F509_9HYPO|nr:Alpha/Beta hydrolase protein [Dactylonectria estremocensis]
METIANTLGLMHESHQYGQHDLQKLRVWRFANRDEQWPGYWIIYIHGGAWRDPRRTADDFHASIGHITASNGDSKIKGFISLDYRLSPHPDFPQDPNCTESSALRDAKHPEHIQDICLGLEFAQKKYQFSDNYILIGHSAGATLAYQLLMGESVLSERSQPEVSLPVVIIGISGIYDLVQINARHDGQYAGFIGAAFDKAHWKSASPAQFEASFRDSWASGKFTILAWSPEDSLVDEPEIDDMASKLELDGVNVEVLKDLTDDHDCVWQEGGQVARLVTLALAKLSTT